MTDILDWSLTEARLRLRNGELTSEELTLRYLSRIEEVEDLNAYVTVTAEKALAMARLSDKRRRQGDEGDLEGIPLGIKDLYCTLGTRTTAGSKMLSTFEPTYESRVTEKLWQAGGVLLGKLNMDEFAMGSANMNSAYGFVKNPRRRRNEDRYSSPGGSSGGSAAAVAARACVASVGTDTGGSIRQPASFTGTVGIKPTYGRCSRYGVISYASSLDQAGPITRTVRDAAVMLKSMSGHDPKDSTSSRQEVPDFEALLEHGVKGLRVGIPRDFIDEELALEIQQMWDEGIECCRTAGMEIVDIDLPHSRYALPVYYIIAPAECSSNLARYDGIRYGRRAAGVDDVFSLYERSRSEGFGKEVRKRILVGTYVLCSGYYDAYFTKAQRVRRLIRNDFESAFAKCDVILTPTTLGSAFLIDEPPSGVDMYKNDLLTVPVNLAGLPGINVPYRKDKYDMPLGMQVIAPPFAEGVMMNVGRVLEEDAQ